MIKNLLGITDAGIDDSDIMRKIVEAQKKNIGFIELVKSNGSVIKISLPSVGYDPDMDKEYGDGG